MQRALLLSLGLGACGGAPVAVPVEAPSVAVPPVVAASVCAVTPPPLPVASARRASRCWARGRPAAVEPARAAGNSCGPLDLNQVDRVEREVRRQIPVQKPNRLVVDFGCSTATGDLAEVWYEDGSGHGGSLRLVRLVRRDDQVSVRQIGADTYRSNTVEVSEGHIAWSTIGPLVEHAHVAMLARPHELVLFDPKATSFTFNGFSSSSNDFHLRLSVVDGEQNVDDRSFTGYDSSSEQEDIVPMRLATGALDRAIGGMKLAATEVTVEDRAFFRRRMQATLAGDPYWWVRERYVEMAAKLGTIDLVPLLVTQVTRPMTERHSDERTRDAAIAAIAAITGWDPRQTDEGQPRPIDEVVAAVAADCSP